MNEPSDPKPGGLRDRLIGLGERSVRKSYYPELRSRLAELERFRALLDRSMDGVFLVDLASGTVTDYNRAALAMVGAGVPDLSGARFSSFFSESDAARLVWGLEGSGQAVAEVTLRPPGGKPLPVEVSVGRVRLEEGEYAVALVRDVSERKRDRERLAELNRNLEAEIRARTADLARKAAELEVANRRLRELDEMKNAFISSVSHELRTPLTSVLGFAKLIRKEFERSYLPHAAQLPGGRNMVPRAQRIAENLGIIEREGERLTRLINDVLDLSKIESGRMEWRDRTLDPGSLAAQARSAMRGQFEMKEDLALEVDAPAGLPNLVADPDRMLQVLLNLLGNAAKFTDHGRVALRLRAPRPDLLRIEVEDTGPGIAREDLTRIFAAFQQAGHETRPDIPAGTGLGLAICREIVEHYSGRIWAESDPGRGSLFVVELPAGPPASSPESVRAPSLRGDAPLVLVADDDPSLRAFLVQVLEDEGFAVLTARDGREALQLAAAHQPDLVTMDIFMPGMDGVEAVRRLREHPRLAGIPVLVLSVLSAVPEDVDADAALAKPVDSEQFLATVGCLLKGRCRGERLLALGDEADPGLGVLLREGYFGAKSPEVVLARSTEDLWARLDEGFSGTVVLTAAQGAALDVASLANRPGVRVIILPEDQEGP
ncbi:MAG: ATP-binding protein [Thermodesulfobacteriota bacterium]